MGSIVQVPLTLANFGDGLLVKEVEENFATILDRFRQAEDGDFRLAHDKATIKITLTIERDPAVGGFKCSFAEPVLTLPPKVTQGTVAVERGGVLVVSSETPAQQLSLASAHPTDPQE